MSLYPLKFKPRFVEKIWGGRKLESVLGKAIPQGKPIGESWELYDFPPGVVDKTDQWVSSLVANGPLAGRTLHSVIQEYGPAIHGDVQLLGGGQFPILLKFLDARDDLSLQVHPDAGYVSCNTGCHLKTEAWYVLESDPGSYLYRGLKPGVSKEQFRSAIADGSVMSLVPAVPTKPGQCFFLPSGTLHALGAGILVAEVQTPSDTTFRVFDFNRLENDMPRQLHVEEALACIRFEDDGAPAEQRRSHAAGYFTTVTRLVTSDCFALEKVRFVEGVEQAIPYDQPVVWMMLEGQAQVRVDGLKEPLSLTKGDTILLPARMRDPVIKTLSDCAWLEVTFPLGLNTGNPA
ncbi:MAG TPA: type I phosphomannose isomerase catalytic subunit [Tepidisphaeraceae bacterium]|jgi:mannose-6-phosphate isomerase